jgi:hypothetical protein
MNTRGGKRSFTGLYTSLCATVWGVFGPDASACFSAKLQNPLIQRVLAGISW